MHGGKYTVNSAWGIHSFQYKVINGDMQHYTWEKVQCHETLQ